MGWRSVIRSVLLRNLLNGHTEYISQLTHFGWLTAGSEPLPQNGSALGVAEGCPRLPYGTRRGSDLCSGGKDKRPWQESY